MESIRSRLRRAGVSDDVIAHFTDQLHLESWDEVCEIGEITLIKRGIEPEQRRRILDEIQISRLELATRGPGSGPSIEYPEPIPFLRAAKPKGEAPMAEGEAPKPKVPQYRGTARPPYPGLGAKGHPASNAKPERKIPAWRGTARPIGKLPLPLAPKAELGAGARPRPGLPLAPPSPPIRRRRAVRNLSARWEPYPGAGKLAAARPAPAPKPVAKPAVRKRPTKAALREERPPKGLLLFTPAALAVAPSPLARTVAPVAFPAALATPGPFAAEYPPGPAAAAAAAGRDRRVSTMVERNRTGSAAIHNALARLAASNRARARTPILISSSSPVKDNDEDKAAPPVAVGGPGRHHLPPPPRAFAGYARERGFEEARARSRSPLPRLRLNVDRVGARTKRVRFLLEQDHDDEHDEHDVHDDNHGRGNEPERRRSGLAPSPEARPSAPSDDNSNNNNNNSEERACTPTTRDQATQVNGTLENEDDQVGEEEFAARFAEPPVETRAPVASEAHDDGDGEDGSRSLFVREGEAQVLAPGENDDE